VVSPDGGQPRKIETGLDARHLKVDWSRDGERIAFTASQGGEPELWLMENFLPKVEPKSMTVRQVWSGGEADACGAPSSDGRYLSCTDWKTGNLAVYDIATGQRRLLTEDGYLGGDSPNRMVLNSKWSPDNRQIVYDLYIVPTYGEDDIRGHVELRIVGLNGSAPRILFSDKDVVWAQSYDWSPDGSQILACFSHKDGTIRNAMVSVADGSVQPLASPGPYYPKNMRFSPNGRYIAYDRPQGKDARAYDLAVISTDGRQETPLVEHPADDRLVGWTPDGKGIVFLSNRTGDLSLWHIQAVNGEPHGAPTLVRSAVSGVPLGLSRQGSFYYYISGQQLNVYVTEIDPRTGEIIAPPTIAINTFEGSNMFPAYSPDGRYMAYISMRSPASPGSWLGSRSIPGRPVLCIRRLEDGMVREVPTEISPDGPPRWSPDAQSILIFAFSEDNSRGIYRVDVHSGQVTPIVVGEAIHGQYEWSQDGNAIFFVRDHRKVSGCQILVYDLQSGQERGLYREPSRVRFAISISPDGRWLAFLNNRGTKRVLRVIPTAGGETRDLHTWENQGGSAYIWHTWSADGKYIFIPIWPRTDDGSGASNAENNRWVLCRIPLTGGEPERLGVEMYARALTAHPDGSHVAFSASSRIKNAEGIWVLENFLSPAVAQGSK
jgi:Tol biopolymer transport system component